jgi:hypothetical protein
VYSGDSMEGYDVVGPHSISQIGRQGNNEKTVATGA